MEIAESHNRIGSHINFGYRPAKDETFVFSRSALRTTERKWYLAPNKSLYPTDHSFPVGQRLPDGADQIRLHGQLAQSDHADPRGYYGVYNVFSNKSVFEIENPYQFLRDNNGVIAINMFIYQGG